MAHSTIRELANTELEFLYRSGFRGNWQDAWWTYIHRSEPAFVPHPQNKGIRSALHRGKRRSPRSDQLALPPGRRHHLLGPQAPAKLMAIILASRSIEYPRCQMSSSRRAGAWAV